MFPGVTCGQAARCTQARSGSAADRGFAHAHVIHPYVRQDRRRVVLQDSDGYEAERRWLAIAEVASLLDELVAVDPHASRRRRRVTSLQELEADPLHRNDLNLRPRAEFGECRAVRMVVGAGAVVFRIPEVLLVAGRAEPRLDEPEIVVAGGEEVSRVKPAVVV